MIPSPLPTNPPICNELADFARSNSTTYQQASKHRFPHTGTGFPLFDDRLPILSAPQMATNGRMSKIASTFAAASPYGSTTSQRAEYPFPLRSCAANSCSLHQSARCNLKSQVRKAAKNLVKSAFSVGTSGADDIRRGNGNESANDGCHAAHVRD